MLRNVIVLLGVLLSGAAYAAQPVPVEVKVEIVRAEFGVFGSADDGLEVFEPTNVVPHTVGQRYGWVIDVLTRNRSLSVREEYVLPTSGKEPDATDLLSGSMIIRIPRRNQVSQRQLVPVDGRIFGEWAIGSDEPAGHRYLQVVIEDQVAASFEFDVK